MPLNLPKSVKTFTWKNSPFISNLSYTRFKSEKLYFLTQNLKIYISKKKTSRC